MLQKLIVILCTSLIISFTLGENLGQNESESLAIPSSSSVIKFVQLLQLNEKYEEAELIIQVHEGTGNWNESLLNLRRSPEVIGVSNGKVKLKVAISCQMFYQLFPFDSHACSVVLKAGVMPAICGELKAHDFRVKGYLPLPLSLLPKEQKIGIPDEKGGLMLYFVVKRSTADQLFGQMYSPVITLVMLSFFTMFSVMSYPIRIGSSFAVLLCLILVTAIFWRDIPHTGEVTALEHYYAICVGLVFQVLFTNILQYWYSALAARKMKGSSSSEQNGDIAPKDTDTEANVGNGKINNVFEIAEHGNGAVTAKVNGTAGEESSKKEKDLSPEEMYIMTLGKCHKLMYFKGLKPAKKQLPIAFVVINVIYWALVIYFKSGLPKGFQYLPSTESISNNPLCL